MIIELKEKIDNNNPQTLGNISFASKSVSFIRVVVREPAALNNFGFQDLILNAANLPARFAVKFMVFLPEE